MPVAWTHSPAKHSLDLIMAGLLIIVALPLFVSIALLIKLTSRGPVFFVQKRLGKNGKPFKLYKFRTMVPGAEKQQKKLQHLNEVDGPVFKIRHDPRFTRLGKWLAHSGLDELPQLFNVLKGEMSLVGPRPLPIKEAEQVLLKWRQKREQVRPGIVSSWVIEGSQKLTFSRWMQLDIQDMKNSFKKDLRILWRSGFIILGKFQDLGKRFVRSLPHSGQILKNWTYQFIHHLLANPTSYALGLLYLITFSLFFLNGGEALSGQILFLAVPLLTLPLIFIHRRSFPKHLPILASLWLLYLLLNLVSTLNSASLSLSASALVRLVAVFVYWLLFSLLFDRQKQLQTLTNLLISVGFLLVGVGLYFLLPQTPEPFSGMNLFYAKYGHNHLASFLLIVIPLVLVRWIKRDSPFLRNLSIFFLANLLLTFSRGALVILPLVAIGIILTYRPKRSQVIFLGTTAILPFVSLLAIMLVSQSNWARSKRDQVEPAWLERQLIKPVNAEGRLNYWYQAWQGWQEQPWLGSGPGTFRLTSLRFQEKPGTYSRFAHSSVMEHLAEVGILGTSAFILLTVTPLIWLWRRHNPLSGTVVATSTAFPLLLGTTALWFHALIDFDFNFTALLLLFWVNIAALMGTTSKKSRKPLSSLTIAGITALTTALFIFVCLSIVGKLLLLKAEQAKNKNQPSLALRRYQRSLQLFPFDQTHWTAVLTSVNQHQWSLSPTLLNQNLWLNQADPYQLASLAQQVKLAGNLDQATKLYQKAAQLYPKNSQYLFELIQLSAASGNQKAALTYLSQAGQEKLVRENYQQYPELIPASLPEFNLDQFTSEELAVYQPILETTNPQFLSQAYSTKLAKLFYALGLVAYQNHQPELVVTFWKTAIYLAPEWSYFHIELAHFYFQLGQDKAYQEALTYCLNFSYPRQHCRQIMQNPKPQPPGFYQDKINREI